MEIPPAPGFPVRTAVTNQSAYLEVRGVSGWEVAAVVGLGRGGQLD